MCVCVKERARAREREREQERGCGGGGGGFGDLISGLVSTSPVGKAPPQCLDLVLLPRRLSRSPLLLLMEAEAR